MSVSSISTAVLRWATRHQLDAEALGEIPAPMLSDYLLLPAPVEKGDVERVVKHLERREARLRSGESFERPSAPGFTGHIFRYTREARAAQRPIFEAERPARVEKGKPLDLVNGSMFEVYWSADETKLIKKARPVYRGFPLSPEAITRLRDDVVSGAALLRDAGYRVVPMEAQDEDELITLFASGTMLPNMVGADQERAELLGQTVIDAARRRFPFLDVDPAPVNMTYAPDGRDYVEWFDPVFGLRNLDFEPTKMKKPVGVAA